jgi:hypothetical protein
VTGDLELTIDPETRVATVSAIDGWKGNGEIVFTATDSAGHADTDTVVVVVRNPAPSIDLPDIFLQEGGSTQLSLDEFAEDDEP